MCYMYILFKESKTIFSVLLAWCFLDISFDIEQTMASYKINGGAFTHLLLGKIGYN